MASNSSRKVGRTKRWDGITHSETRWVATGGPRRCQERKRRNVERRAALTNAERRLRSVDRRYDRRILRAAARIILAPLADQ